MTDQPRSNPHLTLYARSYCHLCEDMLARLRELDSGQPFTVEVIDVDSDPGLEARFGLLVPVLMHGEHELCHYFLDKAAVTAYLATFR